MTKDQEAAIAAQAALTRLENMARIAMKIPPHNSMFDHDLHIIREALDAMAHGKPANN